ncbi:MAG: lipoprotein-releasing ABC transporter permease subunit [Hyphomicrobiales bacterium]|nr:lipoprotein-releasing ABC transporter permease subunit [Hyphomicrobiales bacterium]
MLAFRYLRARRKQGFISATAGFSFVGILVGVAALIIVMSVMNGFRRDLFQKIVGVNGQIYLQSATGPMTDYDALSKTVAAVPGVKRVLPSVEGQGLASTPSGASFALVRGVREADVTPILGPYVKLGDLKGFDAGEGVAIGSKLAEKLALRVGDTIKILTPNGDQTPFGVAPRVKGFPVKAIFEVGTPTFDDAFVFMPLGLAQAFFDKEGQASVIEVYVDDPDAIDAMRQRIREAVGRPLLMTDWREVNGVFFDALTIERNVMFLILSLIVLVAALNMISSLIMLVKAKGRDVAILRTMGATRGAIMRVFLMAGASIGAAGALAGLVVGLMVATHVEAIRAWLNATFGANLFPSQVYMLNYLPSVVEPRDVAAVALLALALSFLATLYPSWRAARLDPVEALRYE